MPQDIPYALLELGIRTPTASKAEIKRAYARKLKTLDANANWHDFYELHAVYKEALQLVAQQERSAAQGSAAHRAIDPAGTANTRETEAAAARRETRRKDFRVVVIQTLALIAVASAGHFLDYERDEIVVIAVAAGLLILFAVRAFRAIRKRLSPHLPNRSRNR